MNAVETIGRALGGKPKPGGGWMCRCPAHDDKEPSLSIDLGDNLRPVLKCWAGCSNQDVISALRDRGLWPERLPLTGGAQPAAEKRTQGTSSQRRPDREAAAAEAVRRWEAAGPANRDHPYLAGKGLEGQGLRQEGRLLLVPMCDTEGAVCSLQTISPEGQKRFLKGGAVSGLLVLIGGPPEPGGPVCVAEGWATGAAIHAATGYPAAVAFSATNLTQVAGIIQAKHPGHQVILCADDDLSPDKENNTGIEAATAAAMSAGGLLAIPGMGKKADFWDLWHEQGPDAVRKAIANAKPVDDAADCTDQNPEQEDPAAMIRYLAGLSALEYEQKRRAVRRWVFEPLPLTGPSRRQGKAKMKASCRLMNQTRGQNLLNRANC